MENFYIQGLKSGDRELRIKVVSFHWGLCDFG